MGKARYQRGTMVFWISPTGDADHLIKEPYWVIEWQGNDGKNGSYWIINAKGEWGVATEEELSLYPKT